jgi:hypothetical protein
MTNLSRTESTFKNKGYSTCAVAPVSKVQFRRFQIHLRRAKALRYNQNKNAQIQLVKLSKQKVFVKLKNLSDNKIRGQFTEAKLS